MILFNRREREMERELERWRASCGLHLKNLLIGRQVKGSFEIKRSDRIAVPTPPIKACSWWLADGC